MTVFPISQVNTLRAKVEKASPDPGAGPEGWSKSSIDPMKLLSVFSSLRVPEMKAYYKAAAAAEDTYMPAGPPISPLTASFFTTWAFYDLRMGSSGDTIGDCQIELNDVIWFNTDQLDALKKLNDSRMGIYEQVGFDGPHVR